MLFVDPTLIVLGLAVLADLVMLGVVLRISGLRRGILHEGGTQALLLVYVLGSLAWAVIQGLYRLQTMHQITGFDPFALARIALYLVLVRAIILYQLNRVFRRKMGFGWLGWLGGLVFLGGAVVLYENPLRWPDILATLPVGNYVVIRWLAGYAVVIAGWGIFMGSLALQTYRNYRETVSPLHRNRIKYWSIAVSLAITGDMLYLALLVLPSNLLHLLAQGILVYVLATHNLPDMRMSLRRSAGYLIMLLLTVALYTGGYFIIQLIFRNVPGFDPLVAAAILALVLAVLFNPLLGTVKRLVNRLMLGAGYDSRQTLSEYSMSISNILDMEVLATVVVGLISEAMEITYGALVTVHQEQAPLDQAEGAEGWSKVFTESEALAELDNQRYLLRSISGLGQAMPEGHLSAGNPAAYFLRREHRPLLQYDIDLQPRFQEMAAEEREWLAELHMDVFVPIYAKENWIGLLALGRKTSGDRYYNDDLDFLQTLADQTAVALENARLFEDLKMRNLENERLNVELKTANTELARLDRAKSDFINIASHELRTPLTQVIGYNDILGEMIKGDELQPAVGVQMVDNVRRAARRLEEIVETMFDVSKLDTKTLDLMRAPVSLSSVITVAIDIWSKGLQERKQTVSVRGLAGLPTIVADGKRLTQVFSHLIQNAIKSTPDGGQIRITGRVVTLEEAPIPPRIAMALDPALAEPAPASASPDESMLQEMQSETAPASIGAIGNGGTIEIENGSPKRSGRAKRNGAKENGVADGSSGGEPASLLGERYVEVVIADTGIGIASDELDRIFEKFYRVGNVLLHSTGDTKFKGAGPGLGLTIARGIVEAHDGRIWAESPGHDEEACPGAKFHVLLPISNISQASSKSK